MVSDDPKVPFLKRVRQLIERLIEIAAIAVTAIGIVKVVYLNW